MAACLASDDSDPVSAKMWKVILGMQHHAAVMCSRTVTFGSSQHDHCTVGIAPATFCPCSQAISQLHHGQDSEILKVCRCTRLRKGSGVLIKLNSAAFRLGGQSLPAPTSPSSPRCSSWHALACSHGRCRSSACLRRRSGDEPKLAQRSTGGGSHRDLGPTSLHGWT